MNTLIAFLIVFGIFAIAFLIAFCKFERKQKKQVVNAWRKKMESKKPDMLVVDEFLEEIK